MKFGITESAAKRIKHLLEKNINKVALRISVDGGGCSGFMYQYNFVDAINDDDFVSENNGIKVVIDPMSQEFLDECSVDFVEELGSNFFQINNPNASAKCGCGSSFSV